MTRRYTIIVWLGNASGQASPALVGAEAAAPLALRLIASLDTAAEDPWPAVPDASPARDGLPRRIVSTSLSLISPTAGEQFVLDPDSPADRQRVLLKASLKTDGGGTDADLRTLWWFVDNQPIAVGDASSQLWWSPVRGNHEIRVVDARGHAALAEVTVR